MNTPTTKFLFMYGLADGERHAVPIKEDGSPDCDFWTIREKIKPPTRLERIYQSRTVSLEMRDIKTQDYRPLMFVIDGVRDWIFIAV
jgi:hypothetical protein